MKHTIIVYSKHFIRHIGGGDGGGQGGHGSPTFYNMGHCLQEKIEIL